MDEILDVLLRDRANLASELSSTRSRNARSATPSQRLEFRITELAVRIEILDEQIEIRRKALGIDARVPKSGYAFH